MPKFVRVAAALLLLLAAPVFAQSTVRPSPDRTAPAPVLAPSTAPVPQEQGKQVELNDVPAPGAAAAGKVDLNAASEAQLDTLPGVGPARAKEIIAHRPYTDLHDLVAKKVLPAGVFDGAKDRMALVNVNTAKASDMAKILPGVGAVYADKIVGGRPYKTPQDMVTKGVVPQSMFDKFKDLVVS